MELEPLFKELNIQDVITHFHPIISIQRRKIIGFEALSRGIYENKIVPPNILFYYAREKNLSIEFDRLCRKKALKNFKELYKKNKDSMLFLNFDASIIDKGVVGSGYIINSVKEIGLSPKNIVIEISEAEVINTFALKTFVETYRNYGFLIALDDVGAKHSNLNRIPELRPDFLKIDKNLIKNIDKEWYKSRIVKAIASLSKEIGTLTIAEGVETREEALCVLELGIDIIQGFYFSKPTDISSIPYECISSKAYTLSLSFRDLMVEKLKEKRKRYRKYKKIIKNILKELMDIPISNFEQRLKKIIRNYSEVECVYILNSNGIQITETIFNPNFCSQLKNPLFKPASKGEDLSGRDYFYYIIYGGLSTYVTEPYISLATGELCVTIAKLFEKNKNKFVLCVDIREK